MSAMHAGVMTTSTEIMYAQLVTLTNRPVDTGSIQGSHRPISFIRIKHRTRANDFFCETE